MKDFDININELYELAEIPKVYLPFTEDLLADSDKIMAVIADGEIYPEHEDFDFELFLEEIPSIKNKIYKKDLKEYKKYLKEYDEDALFKDYLDYDGDIDKYFDLYLKSFPFKIVKISIHCQGFGCSGGPICESTTFIVEDMDNKLSKLTRKKFQKEIESTCR